MQRQAMARIHKNMNQDIKNVVATTGLSKAGIEFILDSINNSIKKALGNKADKNQISPTPQYVDPSNNATKADLFALENKLQTTIHALDKKVDKLETKIESLEIKVDTKIESLEGRMDHLETKFDKLEVKVDKLDQKMDKLGETLSAKIDSQFRWIVGTLIALMLAFGGVLPYLAKILPHL
jgi:predicted nuclease with TOPRIM domain